MRQDESRVLGRHLRLGRHHPCTERQEVRLPVSSLSITDERKQAVDFTDPYYSNKLQFIAPKNVDFKTDKASLKGR